MKITFKKLFVLIAFISFTYAAKAQYSAVSDTARIAIGPDASFPVGNFGSLYKFGIGVSLQLDVPLNDSFYITGNAGYTSFPSSNSSANPNYIIGVTQANMNVAPLKLGLKVYLIRTFYVQAEGGYTLLLNKDKVFALNQTAFTWDPQMGILFKLKHRNYIDAGVRWQKTQSFFGDGANNTFWGVRVAYAFGVK